MGLRERLVITPLTNRVYLSITQALQMQMGCCMIGNEATGKTETVKNLAKIIAIFCAVSNCTVCTDFKSILTVLFGLIQCGAWGCFTNFNRLNISIISMLSTQLYALRTTMHLGLNEFHVILFPLISIFFFVCVPFFVKSFFFQYFFTLFCSNSFKNKIVSVQCDERVQHR